MGFYVPTVDMPGLSLPLLIDGVEYPGVQVDAPDFNQNTGFDVKKLTRDSKAWLSNE
jgi:hypothetical protein